MHIVFFFSVTGHLNEGGSAERSPRSDTAVGVKSSLLSESLCKTLSL